MLAPAGERMTLVKKLLADYPVPKAATKEFLRFIDVGEDSPFELAAIYKIWQKLKPEERRRVEKIARGLSGVARSSSDWEKARISPVKLNRRTSTRRNGQRSSRHSPRRTGRRFSWKN